MTSELMYSLERNSIRAGNLNSTFSVCYSSSVANNYGSITIITEIRLKCLGLVQHADRISRACLGKFTLTFLNSEARIVVAALGWVFPSVCFIPVD